MNLIGCWDVQCDEGLLGAISLIVLTSFRSHKEANWGGLVCCPHKEERPVRRNSCVRVTHLLLQCSSLSLDKVVVDRGVRLVLSDGDWFRGTKAYRVLVLKGWETCICNLLSLTIFV
jgi:hypothetical protein